jgi:glycerol-3-phosphate dehydrogenase (NAD(P)+)
MGDLHVTVGGGRNSRLGTFLGQGNRLSEIVNGPMQGVTVEGLDTGRQLLSGFRHAISNGTLPAAELPLTIGILDSVEYDQLFEFDFTQLPATN